MGITGVREFIRELPEGPPVVLEPMGPPCTAVPREVEPEVEEAPSAERMTYLMVLTMLGCDSSCPMSASRETPSVLVLVSLGGGVGCTAGRSRPGGRWRLLSVEPCASMARACCSEVAVALGRQVPRAVKAGRVVVWYSRGGRSHSNGTAGVPSEGAARDPRTCCRSS